MNNEQKYKECLLHVIKFIERGDPWKPLNADYANRISEMCREVVFNGLTTEQAINKIQV